MRSILLDIIPRRFRRRSYLVSGTIFLRALLNFAGLALLIPVLLLILDSESMHTNPWLERLYQAGRFESDRAFALTVCGCIVALIAFKNLLNLFLLRYERRYIYDLYRCMSRRLYIEYHDRGLGFIKNTNSALLSRNVNFVCLAFVTGILVPLASITSESMLLALLFTALLFYNPTVAGLVLLVFIPTVWFYYSAVRKRLHRYGVQENEGPRGRRNLPGICRPGDQRCLSFDAAPLRPGDGQDRYDSVQKYDRQCLAFDLHGGRTGDRHGAVRGGQPRYAGR